MATTRTADKPKKARKPPKGRPVPGFPRLTVHPDRMGGMPCIRDFRFTAAQALRLLLGKLLGKAQDGRLEAFERQEPDVGPFRQRAQTSTGVRHRRRHGLQIRADCRVINLAGLE